MSSKHILAIAAAIAAAAFPVSSALAKPGQGHGNANGHSQSGTHGNGNGNGNANGHGSSTDGSQETGVAPTTHVPGPPRPGSRNHIARGTVASVDVAGGLVGITVTTGPGGTNRAAQVWRGQTVQFDASSAFLSLDDTNGDQVVDLNDLAVGARVQVQAFVLATDAQPYPARRLTSHAAVEAPTTTTPTTTTTTPTTTTPTDTSTTSG